MRVDPDELRAAAQAITGNKSGTSSSTNGEAYRTAARGIEVTDTAQALTRIATGAEFAIEVVRARLQTWESVLTESADSYQDGDEQGANRIKAMGDFHRRPVR